MPSSTTKRRRTSLSSSWRVRRTWTSRSKELPRIGGLLVRCQVLDNLSPRATPSSIDGHVAEAAIPRNRDPISLPNPTTHAPPPHGQRSQLATWRRATRHGLLITAPIVHTTVLVFPCHLVIQMFSRGEEGLEQFSQFSLPPHPLTTGLGRGQGQKVVARRVLRTTPHQFTSLVKKTIMKRSGASKPPNQKGLSRKLRERIVSDCSQLVPVLELP